MSPGLFFYAQLGQGRCARLRVMVTLAKPINLLRKTLFPVIDQRTIQHLSVGLNVLALAILAVAFYFLPLVERVDMAFIFGVGLGILVFALCSFMLELYPNNTFLLVTDAIFITLITFIAARGGQYGIAVLFLYFAIVVAYSLKYTIAEYLILVLLTIQAAFIYISIWTPFAANVRFGILLLFVFSIVATAFFVWYLTYRVVNRQAKHESSRENLGDVNTTERTKLTADLALAAERLRGFQQQFSGLTPAQQQSLQEVIHTQERAIDLLKNPFGDIIKP
jgi:hypothetical protein